MTVSAKTWTLLFATACLIACGAALAPAWQINFPSQYNQLFRSGDDNSIYLLRHGDDDKPTIHHIGRDGSELSSNPVELPSTEVLIQLGQRIWVADDDYVSYTARDLLRAQAVDLSDYSVSSALPEPLRSPFTTFRGYLKQRNSIHNSASQSVAIYGQATAINQTSEQPIIAVLNPDGSSHYELLSGDILYHELLPLPRSTLYALRILYSDEHFERTGIYTRITFYDADLTPLETQDLPQRLSTITALPDRLHAALLLDPGYLEIHSNGAITPSTSLGRRWTYINSLHFHDEFFYSINFSDRGREICRFDYDLEELGCFVPIDGNWASVSTMLADGTLATVEKHFRVVPTGLGLALGQDSSSVIADINGWGYEESQVFYRFYTPEGILVNEIAAPPYRQYGELVPCIYSSEGLCLWDTTSVTPGTCGANDSIVFSSSEILASESQCKMGRSSGALTLWKKPLIGQ